MANEVQHSCGGWNDPDAKTCGKCGAELKKFRQETDLNLHGDAGSLPKSPGGFEGEPKILP